MDRLVRYEEYTRRDVNNIFNPKIPFTPGAGIYGMHGLIRVPKEDNNQDFIFFVTIGQDRLGYEFTEKISADGKLQWQSQPKQTLDNERIIQLINHNEKKDNIFLFIRHGKKSQEYIYLGTLSYVSHNPDKEQPVHFIWQIMDWTQNTVDKLREIGINIVESNEKVESLKGTKERLVKVEPPIVDSTRTLEKSKTEENIKEDFKPDYIALQQKKSQIGEAGERLIFESEVEYLNTNNKPDLADKVYKMSDINDKVGYDILSYDLDGNEKMIEVKTTTGGKTLGFYLSANEVNVSKKNPDNYYIYRVFNYDLENNTGEYYVVRGDVEDNFNLAPIEFKASPK